MTRGVQAAMLVACGIFGFGCSDGIDEEPQQAGSVAFYAEASPNQLVSEDGWTITFDRIYVNITTPAVYYAVKLPDDSSATQSAPWTDEWPGVAPQHVAGGITPPKGLQETDRQRLNGSFFVDVQSEKGALGRILNVPAKTYNRLDWSMKPAKSSSQGYVDRYKGAALVMIGSAQKDDKTVVFEISFSRGVEFRRCGSNGTDGDTGEHLVGGELTANGDLSVAFGIRPEYLFGDINEGPAETNDTTKINHVAVGFEPFAELAQENSSQPGLFVLTNLTQTEMVRQMSPTTYKFVDMALDQLGYAGLAKCYVFSS